MNKVWNVTITDLLGIFRRSLIAIVPFMEEANLPWKEKEAYDEWDEITASLFNGIVLSACEWGIESGARLAITLPQYNYIYREYSNTSFIKQKKQKKDTIDLVFHSFGTIRKPFDTAKFLKVHKGTLLSEDLVLITAEEIEFILQYQESKTSFVDIDTLHIRIDK